MVVCQNFIMNERPALRNRVSHKEGRYEAGLMEYGIITAEVASDQCGKTKVFL